MTHPSRSVLRTVAIVGDDRDWITLEDLERHGPGLILDVGGGAVGQLLVGDAIFGTNSRRSQLLVWTE
jgi:hypothetical protein